jgi:hypothetical protein
MSKVWAVTFKEFGGAEEIVHDGQRHLLFADEAYGQAVDAFRAVVKDRMRADVTYSYPGEIGHLAHAHIVAESHAEYGGYGEVEDTIELRPYDVIGGGQ